MSNMQIAVTLMAIVIFVLLARMSVLEKRYDLLKNGLNQHRNKIQEMENKVIALERYMRRYTNAANGDLIKHTDAINTLIERVNKIWDSTFMSIKNN